MEQQRAQAGSAPPRPAVDSAVPTLAPVVQTPALQPASVPGSATVPGPAAGETVPAPAAVPVATSRPAPPPAPTARVTGPVDATRLDAPPRLVSGAPPAYPALARRARVEGVVTLRCVLDKEGNVKDVTVLRGLPMGLTSAAVEAVKHWRYAPSTLDGTPVEVSLAVDVTFRLR